jgi:hypothetical protein
VSSSSLIDLICEGCNLLWNTGKHPPNDTLSQPNRPQSQLHCCGNFRSSIFSRIQATSYRWLRTVLSVTNCVQLQRIAVSALFYPWLSMYNRCLSLTQHCFTRDRLCTTVAYCSLRSVLSVATWVQLLIIADSAPFYPWPTVYNCGVLLFLHFFIRDYLCTTTVYRWLNTFIPVHLYATVACCSLCFVFPWPSLYNCCLSLNPCSFIRDSLCSPAV